MPCDNNTKPAPRFAMVLKDHGGVSSFPHAVVMVGVDGMQDDMVSALFSTVGAAKDYATYINESLLEDSLDTGLDMAKSMMIPLLSALPSLFAQMKPRGDVGGTSDAQQPADGQTATASSAVTKPPFLTARKSKTDGGYDVFGMHLNGWKDNVLVAHYDYVEDAQECCAGTNSVSRRAVVTLRKARGGDTYAAYRMSDDGWKGDWLRDFGTDKAAAEAFATAHNRAALGMGQTAAETA